MAEKLVMARVQLLSILKSYTLISLSSSTAHQAANDKFTGESNDNPNCDVVWATKHFNSDDEELGKQT
jgi:hypothetical protein